MATKRKTPKTATKTRPSAKPKTPKRPTIKAKRPTPKTTKPTTARQPSPQRPGSAKGPTRVTVRFDAGFGNELFVRGEGANLRWDRGIPLKNVRPDEWQWETRSSFKKGEFKILINDQVFEAGENRSLPCGRKVEITPFFPDHG